MTHYTGLSKGLIIKAPFMDWILSGRKPWELRSSHSKQRGPIALILQGSGTLVGVARLIDSIDPRRRTAREPGVAKLCLAREPERMHVVGCVKGSLRRAAPALEAANHVKCSPTPKPPPRPGVNADQDPRLFAGEVAVLVLGCISRGWLRQGRAQPGEANP